MTYGVLLGIKTTKSQRLHSPQKNKVELAQKEDIYSKIPRLLVGRDG
jgi:hypothetical protein